MYICEVEIWNICTFEKFNIEKFEIEQRLEKVYQNALEIMRHIEAAAKEPTELFIKNIGLC